MLEIVFKLPDIDDRPPENSPAMNNPDSPGILLPIRVIKYGTTYLNIEHLPLLITRWMFCYIFHCIPT